MENPQLSELRQPLTSEAVTLPADSNQAQGIGQYAKEPLLAFPFLGSRVSGFEVWESLGGVGKHDRLLYSSASRA